MTDFGKGAAVVAVVLAVAAAASPALAAKRTSNNPGYAARAQAVGSDITGTSSGMSRDRESAIRECSAKMDGLKQYTWGVQQGYAYRNCMAGHGQVE